MARYNCPDCGGDRVEILVRYWAALDQSYPNNFETEAADADQGWDHDGDMRCCTCWHVGSARAFEEAGTGYEGDEEEDDDGDLRDLG